MASLRVESLVVSPLSVPLVEPFVIASGRIDVTRAALVELTLIDEGSGARARGLGEAAALPPVTREDQPDLLRAIEGARASLIDRPIDPALEAIAPLLDPLFP